MPKKRKQKTRSLKPEQVAEKAKKHWKAVPPLAADSSRRVPAEAASPELDVLKQKYFGNASSKSTGTKASKRTNTTIVLMEPKTPDDRVGRKAVLVDKGKVVGEQG